jgi:hypothetical protein
MNAETARRFVAGKLFSFNCFDGSRGAGRIFGDGSVIGTVQFQGSGPVKSLWLPAGTLRVKGEAYCASLKGMPFEPCFNLNRMDDRSFRGSISGMGFAYCDFTRRLNVAGIATRHRGGQPVALNATPVALNVTPVANDE